MKCRHMADLMPEHAGKLRFVVHQGGQLARDVDISAGNREGIVHRRIQQGYREIALCALRPDCTAIFLPLPSTYVA